ncbi:MAG: glycoside hydrolase family 1 protein [Elusimicrobia bacterium]|nr:glycoside hydrolase family 1 protein [Elusimicrobiota bacterium]
MGIITFPKGFLWGASTSSYQIEGGNRGSALWDWERRKGWERSGDAAGSWERFDEDVACLKALHLNAYRFSVEWSRVQPTPDGFDEAALRRYAAWASRLRSEGIRPFVSLHHFSEPAWLLRRHPRGWFDDAVPARFLRFAERTAAALGESVADWVVFNEPMVFLVGAYGMAFFPPGRRLLARPRLFSPLVENVSRAHNECYKLLHRLQPGCRVCSANNIAALDPARPGDEEAVAAWDRFMHRDFIERTKEHVDIIGVNYYTRIYVHRSFLSPLPGKAVPGYAELVKGITGPLFSLIGGRRGSGEPTGMGWEVFPEGLGRVVTALWRDYGKPIVVLENGIADAAGERREGYVREHLKSLAGAMAAGADVRGYFHWSLVDNYEWGSYRPRFGLFTRERRPAGGSSFYAAVARAGEVETDG